MCRKIIPYLRALRWKKYRLTFSPETAWVFKQLHKLTSIEDSEAVASMAVNAYSGALSLYCEEKTPLLAGRHGKRPLPLHLTDPKNLVSLPPEAYTGPEEHRPVWLYGDDIGKIEVVLGLADTNITGLFERALFFNYDLFLRRDRGETFYKRDRSTGSLEVMRILVGPNEEDDETDPAA